MLKGEESLSKLVSRKSGKKTAINTNTQARARKQRKDKTLFKTVRSVEAGEGGGRKSILHLNWWNPQAEEGMEAPGIRVVESIANPVR